MTVMKKKSFTVQEIENQFKQKTAIFQLLDSLDTCKRLGCKVVQIEDIITHIRGFQDIEIQQIKNCFNDGREFQANEENKDIPFAESAKKHIEKEYTYFSFFNPF